MAVIQLQKIAPTLHFMEMLLCRLPNFYVQQHVEKGVGLCSRRLFPFRKQAMPFLTVDAIIGNQACHN